MSRVTGYVFEELCMWHDAGSIAWSKFVEPGEAWENPHTKRRIHNLLCTTGMINNLRQIKGRYATRDEILRFHTARYVDSIKAKSDENGGVVGNDSDHVRFAKGGYEIALLSAGGLLSAVEELLIKRSITNAYCLIRPPGHHAVSDCGMGFCIFNNVVLAAYHARSITSGACKRIAVVDYDVHHGNGTQEAFWNDTDAMLISLHQDNNYPQGTGSLMETGGLSKSETQNIINIPLPPGSGSGAYTYAFDRVVIPALYRFKPDLILVSSGFDASFADPLAAMILSSEAFGSMTASLVKAADDLCGGKLIFTHEGGYSKDYVSKLIRDKVCSFIIV